MRTREAGAPIDSVASTGTPAIGLFGSSLASFATGSAPTLRKSSSNVSASGRVATYGTGSLASITSDAFFAFTREVMAVSLASETLDVPAAASETAPQAVAIANDKQATPFTASPSRLRATATTCAPRAAFVPTADR